MLRIALTLFLVFLSGSPALALCSGQSIVARLNADQRAELDAAVALTPYGQGTLWTATRGDTTLTVVGTMHLYDPRLEGLLDRVRSQVQGADLVLVEMTKAEEKQMQQALLTRPETMIITSGPTLPDVLDAATWAQLSEAAAARQIPPFMAAKFQPWYLMLVLSMPPCAMQDALAGQRGLDHMIMDLAETAGVPTQAVEPWDTLFSLFEGDSFEDQVAMLRLSILDPGLQEEMFVAMLEGYAAGRIAEVWELSRLSSAFIPGMDKAAADALFVQTEQLLLIDRNRAWLPVIETAAGNHRNIVLAVGAAHLSGRDGVLQGLENKGWTIAPLP